MFRRILTSRGQYWNASLYPLKTEDGADGGRAVQSDLEVVQDPAGGTELGQQLHGVVRLGGLNAWQVCLEVLHGTHVPVWVNSMAVGKLRRCCRYEE